MKFTCDKSVLLSGLNKVKQAAEARSKIHALQCILIEASGDALRFTATNLELAIQSSITGASVEVPGKVLVPAKILSDVVRGLTGELQVEVNDDKLLIHFSESVIRLNILEVTEFPTMPENIIGETIEIGCEVVKTALSKTMFAMSSDIERPAFNGTLLKLRNGKLDFVTTDAHRLALYSSDVETDLDIEAIVQRETIKELYRLIGKDGSNIKITISQEHVQFAFGDITILSRRVLTQFPNYNAVIPKNQTASAVLNKADLLASIKRASIFKNTNNQIVGIQGKNKITITASIDLFGSLEEKLSAIYGGEEEIKIYLCTEWMLQALSAMQGSEVTLNYFGTYGPLVMGEENFIQLLLPVRVG